MHGAWMAPPQGYHDPEAVLLIGANPYVSYEGAPTGNPGWMNDRIAAGMKLIVIDPRRTETADRATIHLRPRPGHDAEILAAFLRVVIDENHIDHEFVAAEVTGVAALRAALETGGARPLGERSRCVGFKSSPGLDRPRPSLRKSKPATLGAAATGLRQRARPVDTRASSYAIKHIVSVIVNKSGLAVGQVPVRAPGPQEGRLRAS
jgi:anaerobic selenocysteine-containing dehydrogenase